MSIKALSAVSDNSYKAVQNDIDFLNDLFKEKHYETRIVTERGKGVYLDPKNKNEIQSIVSYLGEDEEVHSYEEKIRFYMKYVFLFL